MNPSLHILGGGPAGLAAGHHARKRGVAFRIYEAGTETGGNCRTLELGEFRFDTGAHRLHARDAEVTAEWRELLGETLREIDAPSRIVHGNGLLRFPPTPRDLVRHLELSRLLHIGKETLFRRKPREGFHNFHSFHDLATARYGPTLAEMFLLGYTRKLWGRDPGELSPEVAGARLKGLDLATFLTCGLFRSRHLDAKFLYPEHGIGSLFREVARRFPEGSVHCDSPITRVRHDGNRIRGITLEETREVETPTVISTLPLPFLLRALDPPPPPELLESAANVRFRNVILCVLCLDFDRYTENASLYFPDPGVPFTRLYEPKNRSSAMAPRGKTCVVLEIPCDAADAIWGETDADLVSRLIPHLDSVRPIPSGSLLQSAVYRVPNAYPILERGTETVTESLRDYCGRFANLRLAGRNALFRYAHIHDMFRQGKEAVESLQGTSYP